MPSSGAPEVSLVIPAYNEALRLESCVRALRAYLSGVRWTHEVILVIEHSTDGSLDLARRLIEGGGSFEIMDNKVQRGKGHAVRCGMSRARGDIAFFMDADLSTPLTEIDGFLNHLAAHPEVDVLIGNRAHPQSVILRRQGWLRRSMGDVFNLILRRVTGIRFRDTQCGFKAFRRKAREAIFAQQQLDGFAFDAELLLLAEKLGFRVEDRPVQWTNSANSKVHIVRDSWRMLRDALRMRRVVSEAKGAQPARDRS